ncbi:MFS transporter [Alicyclobacillus tolerans]|uniref:MFS transporter n=1 Tax=Alicyclobacillus tolerans TaxID=90970 RepID=UPI0027D7D343|nr:MFS transporter [Alicyclobacillus tengchongensis]
MVLVPLSKRYCALPILGGNFHVSVSEITWTVTLYLLSLTTTLVFFGRVSDRVGRLKVYSWRLMVFATTSILCGGAFSVPQLILFRGLQGLGTAMLQASSTVIITTCIPQERRGVALGSLAMMIGLGPVLGPSISGTLLSFAGWKFIFLINVPICLLDLWRTVRIMRVLPFCLFDLSLIVYIVLEKRASSPIIPLSLFQNASFVVPMFAVTMLGLATAVAFIVSPYFLEQVSNLLPCQVGLVNLVSPLGLVILSRISSKRIEVFGAPLLMIVRLSVMSNALGLLSMIQPDWNAVLLGVLLLLLYGVGASIFVPANLTAIMGSVGTELQGTIGAFQQMVQNMGIAIGTSIATTMIHAGMNNGVAGYVGYFGSCQGNYGNELSLALDFCGS